MHTRLICENDQYNKVEYIYDGFLNMENTTVWQRQKMSHLGMVKFSMLSSVNNSPILPQVATSVGHYKITPIEDQWTVEYYPKCTLEKQLFTPVYLKLARNEAFKFMINLESYLIEQSKSPTSSGQKIWERY